MIESIIADNQKNVMSPKESIPMARTQNKFELMLITYALRVVLGSRLLASRDWLALVCMNTEYVR